MVPFGINLIASHALKANALQFHLQCVGFLFWISGIVGEKKDFSDKGGGYGEQDGSVEKNI